jgi:GLPGLI family protein
MFAFAILFLHEAKTKTPVYRPFPKPTPRLVVDSGSVRIWYAFNAVDINNPETYDDLQRLEIGSHISKYYSYFVYNSDSLCMDFKDKHPEALSLPNWMGNKGKDVSWSEYYYTDYIKNFSTGKLTEYTYMPRGINHCQYTESIPTQEWKLEEETITISGYQCQKATCRFRGRNFTAWFTPEIPINNGPWKFGELPGLILKVYDMDKQYIFECTQIENFKQKYPIKMHNPKNFMQINRTKYRKLITDINEDYHRIAGIVLESGKKTQKESYQPLELE